MRRKTASLVAVLAFAASGVGLAQDTGSQAPGKLEEAKRDINLMREIYQSVVRKEDEAKAEHDPVRLNCVHQNSSRINDLVSVADHALDDMRIAVSTRQPEEAADAELEKIVLAKTKVEQVQKDADRCVGIKVVGADNGEGETTRDFSNTGSGADDPLLSLMTGAALPGTAVHAPPASPTGQ
jgi:hypothetical protein